MNTSCEEYVNAYVMNGMPVSILSRSAFLGVTSGECRGHLQNLSDTYYCCVDYRPEVVDAVSPADDGRAVGRPDALLVV